MNPPRWPVRLSQTAVCRPPAMRRRPTLQTEIHTFASSLTPAELFRQVPVSRSAASQLGRAEDAHLDLAGQRVDVHRNVIFERDLHRLLDFEVELQTVALN